MPATRCCRRSLTNGLGNENRDLAVARSDGSGLRRQRARSDFVGRRHDRDLAVCSIRCPNSAARISEQGSLVSPTGCQTGTLLASHWDDAEQPIPLGSLVKPFIALAYGEEHQFHYPTHVCTGASGGCWLPRGHGEVGIVSAIAYSCNSYFRMLTADMTSADVIPAAKEFGLESPGPKLSGRRPDRRGKSLAHFSSAHGARLPGTESPSRPAWSARSYCRNGGVRRGRERDWKSIAL